MYVVTPKQMKCIEDYSELYGVSKKQLMKNAGNKLAECINSYCNGNTDKKIVFLVGSGNNGGDCSVSAKVLMDIGYKNVSLLLVCGLPKTELSKEMYNNISESVVTSEDCISEADVIIDGVFGTGFHGELDKNISDILNSNNKAYKIAVDIPSGGNSYTGTVSDGTFKADETLTFGFVKTGLLQYPLKDFCGKISVADIGIPEKAKEFLQNERIYTFIKHENFLNFPPLRKSTSHKGTFGKILIVAGSNLMRGAAYFAVSGALRSGAGLVQLATTQKCIDTVSILAPEATFIELPEKQGCMDFVPEKLTLNNYDTIVIGCGMGVTQETIKLTKFVIENSEIPVIIDADGINCISSDIDILLKKKTDIILTPHVGEMSRLLKCSTTEISANRFYVAESFAEKYDVTVVLKGAGTVIANAKKTAINSTGNAGMSRGGSGDILSGIIGALSGQKYSAFESACIGTYIHGLAGDIASEKFTQESMLPRDIINCLSDSFRKIK